MTLPVGSYHTPFVGYPTSWSIRKPKKGYPKKGHGISLQVQSDMGVGPNFMICLVLKAGVARGCIA